jgi:hypothetical protein
MAVCTPTSTGYVVDNALDGMCRIAVGLGDDLAGGLCQHHGQLEIIRDAPLAEARPAPGSGPASH